jgi:hypothetical protein
LCRSVCRPTRSEGARITSRSRCWLAATLPADVEPAGGGPGASAADRIRGTATAAAGTARPVTTNAAAEASESGRAQTKNNDRFCRGTQSPPWSPSPAVTPPTWAASPHGTRRDYLTEPLQPQKLAGRPLSCSPRAACDRRRRRWRSTRQDGRPPSRYVARRRYAAGRRHPIWPWLQPWRSTHRAPRRRPPRGPPPFGQRPPDHPDTAQKGTPGSRYCNGAHPGLKGRVVGCDHNVVDQRRMRGGADARLPSWRHGEAADSDELERGTACRSSVQPSDPSNRGG